MLIFGGDLKPLILDNVTDPIVSDYVWTLDVDQQDFCFDHITFLDEHYEKGIGFSFDGQYVEIPESWYILVMDPINGMMDLVQTADIRGRVFDAFIYSHQSVIPRSASMVMKNARVFKKFCYPILNRNLMLVHPIDEGNGIVISPHNVFKKIKDTYVMDFYDY